MEDISRFASLKGSSPDIYDWLDTEFSNAKVFDDTAGLEQFMSNTYSELQVKCMEVQENITDTEESISKRLPSFSSSAMQISNMLIQCNDRLNTIATDSASESDPCVTSITQMDLLKSNISIGVRIIRELQQWDIRVRDIKALLGEGRALQASQLISELFKILPALSSAPSFSQRQQQLAGLSDSVTRVIHQRLTSIFSSSRPQDASSTSEVRTLVEVSLLVQPLQTTSTLPNVLRDALRSMAGDLWSELFFKQAPLAKALAQLDQPAVEGEPQSRFRWEGGEEADVSIFTRYMSQVGAALHQKIPLLQAVVFLLTQHESGKNARKEGESAIVPMSSSSSGSVGTNNSSVSVDTILKLAIRDACSMWFAPLIRAAGVLNGFTHPLAAANGLRHLMHCISCGLHALSMSPLCREVPRLLSRTAAEHKLVPLEVLDASLQVEARRLKAILGPPDLSAALRTTPTSDRSSPAGKTPRLSDTLAKSPSLAPGVAAALQAEIETALAQTAQWIETVSCDGWPTLAAHTIMAVLSTSLVAWAEKVLLVVDALPSAALKRVMDSSQDDMLLAASRVRVSIKLICEKVLTLDSQAAAWSRRQAKRLASSQQEDIPESETGKNAVSGSSSAAQTLAVVLSTQLKDLHSQQKQPLTEERFSLASLGLSQSDISSISAQFHTLTEDHAPTVVSGTESADSHVWLLAEMPSVLASLETAAVSGVSSCCSAGVQSAVQNLFTKPPTSTTTGVTLVSSLGEGDALPREEVHLLVSQHLATMPQRLLDTQILAPQLVAEALRGAADQVVEAAVSSVKAMQEMKKGIPAFQLAVDLLFLWRLCGTSLGPVSKPHLLDQLSCTVEGLMRLAALPVSSTCLPEVNMLKTGLPAGKEDSIMGVVLLMESKMM